MPAAILILHRKACQRPEVERAVNRLLDRGADLEVRITWRATDIPRIVAEGHARGVERFIAGGGDGTVNAVARAIYESQAQGATLGVLPLGTANDFARGAGIPVDDLGAALSLAIEGVPRVIDLGVINGQCFVNVASGGFGAEITATTPPDLKRLLGGAAYTLVGLARAWQLQPYRCEVEIDDSAPESVDILALAVGNNRFAGGGYEVAPQARLDDGLLDFAALSPLAIEQLRQAMRNDERTAMLAELTRYTRARRCVLRSDRPMQLNLDGEPLVASEFVFTVHPAALQCVTGPTEAGAGVGSAD